MMPISFSQIIRWGVATLGVVFVFQMFSVVYAYISGASVSDAIFFFAGGLSTDREDRTNVLLLGVGGGDHDGGQLTDTIMLASYHHTYETVSMLSIPRDVWVEAGDGVGMRINAVYEYERNRLDSSERALGRLSENVSRIANVPVHYYAKIDFAGFTDMVDAIGGVDVLVPYNIRDPQYPCPGLQGYCPLRIDAGLRSLDGDLALKFARSRKSTSDFSRAERQQLLIAAIREKALTTEVLGNPRKIRELFGIIEDRFETNMSIRELIAGAELLTTFDRNKINSIVLSDEPTLTGGILIPPPRELYGGAAVLIPEAHDYSDVHALTDILFNHPDIIAQDPTIEVLNASGIPRIAERVAYYLNRYGLNTARINNYPERAVLPTTSVQLHRTDDEPSAAVVDLLPRFMPDIVVEESDPLLMSRGFDITIVLGEDTDPENYR